MRLFLLSLLLLLPPGVRGSPDIPPLTQRIGQMVMVGFRGLEAGPDSAIHRAIRELNLGGVVLFDHDVPTGSDRRNIASPAQLRQLTDQLQGVRPGTLLIAVDQEGGRVARLGPDNGFQAGPSARELGRGEPEATREQGRRTARRLAAAGINWNFAPVVDLARNPENPVIAGLGRSFGTDPERVSEHAGAFIRGHRREGVLTAIKHFPGHGSARGDSHKGLVDITATWDPVELAPYRRLLDRDLVDAVMVGHLRHRGLDPRWPATLSPAITGGLLRDELGFGGVAVTDDLQMGAIRKHHSLRTVIRQALRADADLLLFANNTVYQPRIAHRAVAIIRELVERGTVSEARINRSYRRIRALKVRVGATAGEAP